MANSPKTLTPQALAAALAESVYQRNVADFRVAKLDESALAGKTSPA